MNGTLTTIKNSFQFQMLGDLRNQSWVIVQAAWEGTVRLDDPVDPAVMRHCWNAGPPPHGTSEWVYRSFCGIPGTRIVAPWDAWGPNITYKMGLEVSHYGINMVENVDLTIAITECNLPGRVTVKEFQEKWLRQVCVPGLPLPL